MARVNWLADGSGSFEQASNWSGGVVPGAQNGVVLNAAGNAPYTVTAFSSETVKFITTKRNATLHIASGTFTLEQGTGAGASRGIIDVGKHATLSASGELSNAGTIAVENYGLITSTGSLTLTGGGVVTGGLESAIFAGINSVTNYDNTIEGTTILHNLINEAEGVVDANSTLNTGQLYVGGSTVNDGIMEATNGGKLTISDDTSLVNNGTISANGGIVEIIQGVVGSGICTINGGTLSPNTNVQFGQDVYFTGHTGVFTLSFSHGVGYTGTVTGLSDHGGNYILLYISVGGSNSVAYSGNAQGGVLSVYSGGELDGTIRLAGNYLNDTFSLVKHGRTTYKLVVQSPQSEAASLLRFTAAAAAFEPSVGEHVHQVHADVAQPTLLGKPHASIA